jgi:hypothetical protein
MGLGNWLRNHPHGLERMYPGTKWLFGRLDPIVKRIGYDRADRWFRIPEKLAKEIVFDCRMCGQCILHSTGMTCPMTCPKELRNGPCGGVQADGRCEVSQIGRCVWVDAYERSRKMHRYGDDIVFIQPPVNRRLQDSSAWINMLTKEDGWFPSGWDSFPKILVSSKADR